LTLFSRKKTGPEAPFPSGLGHPLRPGVRPRRQESHEKRGLVPSPNLCQRTADSPRGRLNLCLSISGWRQRVRHVWFFVSPR
jgi:hypothetical protein